MSTSLYCIKSPVFPKVLSEVEHFSTYRKISESESCFFYSQVMKPMLRKNYDHLKFMTQTLSYYCFWFNINCYSLLINLVTLFCKFFRQISGKVLVLVEATK